MTAETEAAGPRRSRWLPAVVFSLFAAILLVDVVVVVLYGNYRNLVEEPGIEVMFTPVGSQDAVAVAEPTEPTGGAPLASVDGRTVVAPSPGGYRVLEPGTLTLRFRSPDAGAFLELGYRFENRRPDADVELLLGRVASRYGVDTMCRRSITAERRKRGVFRHYLADHAGWFELRLEVGPAAAADGFEVESPRVVDG